jgi:hypothetical protein
MLEIIDGPSRESLAESFVRRQPVVVTVATGKKYRMLIINKLEHEDGSGYNFLFVTFKGITGFYNAQTRKGQIKV